MIGKIDFLCTNSNVLCSRLLDKPVGASVRGVRPLPALSRPHRRRWTVLFRFGRRARRVIRRSRCRKPGPSRFDLLGGAERPLSARGGRGAGVRALPRRGAGLLSGGVPPSARPPSIGSIGRRLLRRLGLVAGRSRMGATDASIPARSVLLLRPVLAPPSARIPPSSRTRPPGRGPRLGWILDILLSSLYPAILWPMRRRGEYHGDTFRPVNRAARGHGLAHVGSGVPDAWRGLRSYRDRVGRMPVFDPLGRRGAGASLGASVGRGDASPSSMRPPDVSRARR